jgi:hypothetical protein
VRYPARRYAIGAGLAEAVWATYSVGLGYFGGLATSNSLYAVGLGLGVSLLVAGLGGLVQWAARRRGRSAQGAELVVAAGGGAVVPGAVVPSPTAASADGTKRAANAGSGLPT